MLTAKKAQPTAGRSTTVIIKAAVPMGNFDQPTGLWTLVSSFRTSSCSSWFSWPGTARKSANIETMIKHY